MTRRQFIRITGGAAAAALVGGGAGLLGWRDYKLSHLFGDPDPYGGARQIPTFCEVCFWHCGLNAYVRDGELLKVEGNPRDPLANGRLCPRGMAALDFLNDPDRLRRPLLRYTAHDGEQRFREVGWNEALDFTAGKLREIRDTAGPEAVALLFHGKGGP